MRDLYLRFPNRETAVALAEQFGLYVVDSQGADHLISASNQLAIDVVGTVYEPTGNTVTHNGMTSPEMVPVPCKGRQGFWSLPIEEGAEISLLAERPMNLSHELGLWEGAIE